MITISIWLAEFTDLTDTAFEVSSSVLLGTLEQLIHLSHYTKL